MGVSIRIGSLISKRGRGWAKMMTIENISPQYHRDWRAHAAAQHQAHAQAHASSQYRPFLTGPVQSQGPAQHDDRFLTSPGQSQAHGKVDDDQIDWSVTSRSLGLGV